MDGTRQYYSEMAETWLVAIQCGLLLMKNEMAEISKLFEALPSQTKVISGAWKMEKIFLLQNNCKFL